MMFITQNVPSSLRGELTRWMLQLKPGVFLGTLSALVGEKLWNKIQDKQSKGGAIWVKATNNEQKFKLSVSGNTNWTISDFDGLQLITHLNKKSKKMQDETKARKNKVLKKKGSTQEIKEKNDISKITWDTEDIPLNFITRKIQLEYKNSEVRSVFSGTSAYREYPPDTVWRSPWMDDIKKIAESLIIYIINSENEFDPILRNKKLACLDIETTDYLPKAYEGFVNIIGITCLNLGNIKEKNLSLELFQAFNMTRKKLDAPKLLKLVSPYLENIDTLLVFNKNFDIKILKTIINEFSIDISLPSNIIDMQDYFPNLKALEDFLEVQVGIKRATNEKGKYSEYYELFKGKGKNSKDKQIEPIGTYNLTDALTPLYAYILMKLKNKGGI